jgi:hypothetical protein
VHCRDHAVQLHRARSELETSGALVLIGQGTPRQAAHFRRRLGIELTVLTDEDRSSYDAAGAKRATLSELLGPRSVVRGMRAGARSGVRQGRVIGDPAQLGGAMVVAPDGTLAWSHMSEDASDNAGPAQIARALRAA